MPALDRRWALDQGPIWVGRTYAQERILLQPSGTYVFSDRLRSPGGHQSQAQERRNVRIIYLDVAEMSKSAQAAVVAGVIVEGDRQLRELRFALRKFLQDHVPASDRNTLVPDIGDILEGRGYFDERCKPEWTWERRATLLRDLAELPTALGLHTTWGAIQNNHMLHQQLGQARGHIDGVPPAIDAAWDACLVNLERWSRQNTPQETCLIILDDDSLLKRMTGVPRELRAGQDIAFQQRCAVHPLILADFIACFVQLRLIGDKRSLEFTEPWIRQSAATRTFSRLE